MRRIIIPLAIVGCCAAASPWAAADEDRASAVAAAGPATARAAGDEDDPARWQPQTRLRPIDELGEASRDGASRSGTRQTAARASVPVRQATYQQQPSDASQITAPALPPSPAEDSGGFSSPPATQPPGSYSDGGAFGSGVSPGSSTYSEGSAAPIYSDSGSVPSGWQPAGSATSSPGWSGTQPATGGFATVDNHPCVTGPAQQTRYTVSGYHDCDTGAPIGAAPPAAILPPTLTPNMAPAAYAGSAGYRPLLNFGRQNYNVEVGQGIIGQPVAYVPGQPVRNFFRYIFP